MKNFLKIMICCVLVITLTFNLSHVMKKKDGYWKYYKFYEAPTEYEVLFFGASVVNYGIYPNELWNNYGITSYNFGNPTERLSMTYWTMRNALDYAAPKVVVVDLTAMSWAGTTRDNTLLDHNFLDSVPFSKTKVAEVFEIFSGKERIEYLFPMYLYHSRWNDLKEEDFVKPNYYVYGANMDDKIAVNEEPDEHNYDESRYGDVEFERQNLERIVNLCEEKGIKLVFTYLPYVADGGDQKLREFCKEYCLEINIPYYDMLWLDIIEWDKDFFDQVHLNSYGAIKVTNYIGEELIQRYDVGGRHAVDQIAAQRWDDDFKKYNEFAEKYR